MESELLTARILDTSELCAKTGRFKFLGFLSVEEAAAAEKTLSKRGVKFTLFGGYDEAQRVMLACLPDWADSADFPITPITILYRKTDVLHHRDFLGSLMGLGITRESVGDILVEEGRAVIFITSDISGFVLSQLEKVGRIGVTLKEGYSLPLPLGDTLVEASTTIASARLDCVVAGLANVSRNTAAELIAEGRVSLNSFVEEKATRTVSPQDAVTIRGKGKFIIISTDQKTKKDRIVLRYKKYS